MVKTLNLLILTAVVDSHNSEVDEQERIDRRKADQECNAYLQRILNSDRKQWRQDEGKIYNLE